MDFLARDAISVRHDGGCSGQSSLLCTAVDAGEIGLIARKSGIADADEEFSSREGNFDDDDSALEYGTDFEKTNRRRKKRIAHSIDKIAHSILA